MATDARRATGAFPGLSVLFEKEISDSARSKLLLAFALIMTVVAVLVPVLGRANIDALNSSGRRIITGEDMDNMMATWAALIGYLGGLMVIASTVDAVTRERAVGITAWIMTKPVSRRSYLFAKALAHSAMAICALVLLPAVVSLTLLVLFFQDIPVGGALLAVLILSVEMTFLSFTVVALGVAFRSVAPVAIIALALWLVPNVVPAIASLDWTIYVLPSFLPLAATVPTQQFIEDAGEAHRASVTIPLSAMIIALVAFTASVLYFEEQEL